MAGIILILTIIASQLVFILQSLTSHCPLLSLITTPVSLAYYQVQFRICNLQLLSSVTLVRLDSVKRVITSRSSVLIVHGPAMSYDNTRNSLLSGAHYAEYQEYY